MLIKFHPFGWEKNPPIFLLLSSLMLLLFCSWHCWCVAVNNLSMVYFASCQLPRSITCNVLMSITSATKGAQQKECFTILTGWFSCTTQFAIVLGKAEASFGVPWKDLLSQILIIFDMVINSVSVLLTVLLSKAVRTASRKAGNTHALHESFL